MIHLVPIWRDRNKQKAEIENSELAGVNSSRKRCRRLNSDKSWWEKDRIVRIVDLPLMLRVSLIEHLTDQIILTPQHMYSVYCCMRSFFGHTISYSMYELDKCVTQGKVHVKRRRGIPKATFPWSVFWSGFGADFVCACSAQSTRCFWKRTLPLWT